VIITEKWNTDNTLGTTLEVKDQFARGILFLNFMTSSFFSGLNVTLDTTYAPQSAKRAATLKTEWAGDNNKVILLLIFYFYKC